VAQKRSLVLLSSGLDSTVNLFEAAAQSQVVLALTFDYGQRAAPRERAQAAKLAAHLGVPHKVVELPWFKDFTRTALVERSASVPVKDKVSIDDFKASTETAKAVWVPNRNGILLNIAAGFAEGLGADWVIPGFNAEEAVTFPDNTGEFLNALTESFRFSTSNRLEAVCFTTKLNKTEIVKRGVELKVPFELIWPCYFDGPTPCGECESCQRFRRATSAANVQIAFGNQK
jgi:7-cyano-7-deazaguanine synthase